MNLYKITFTHYAPKDNESGIKCLLLADNDEQVFDWIASEPRINGNGMFNSWYDYSKITYDHETDNYIDEDGNDANDDVWWGYDEDELSFKDRMIRLKGEQNDSDSPKEDLYYGLTLYGWELIKENVTDKYSDLIEAGIVFKSLNYEDS